jgi:hypothetical protein
MDAADALSESAAIPPGIEGAAPISLLKVNLTGQVVAPPNRQHLG